LAPGGKLTVAEVKDFPFTFGSSCCSSGLNASLGGSDVVLATAVATVVVLVDSSGELQAGAPAARVAAASRPATIRTVDT
jgi:hypothetical protein